MIVLQILIRPFFPIIYVVISNDAPTQISDRF